MAGDDRRRFNDLLSAEVLADTSSSKDTKFRQLRHDAAKYFEAHYMDLQLGALVPYIAMTLVDHVHLSGEIPIHVKSSNHNGNLFFASCLHFSSEFLSKGIKPTTKFLTGLKGCTVHDMLEMTELIRKKIDWSSPQVTPFSFICYFSSFFTPQPSDSALRPVYQLIITSQFDIAFTQFRPSVMAVAAMLVFTTNELPDQHEYFKSSIIDHFVDQQEMINKCQMMLEPLYVGGSNSDGPQSDVGIDDPLMKAGASVMTLGWTRRPLRFDVIM